MKKVVISILAGVMLFISILFSGCIFSKNKNHWSDKKEENGFYYYLSGQSATILGLVNSSETIEELVIPEKLGGCDVTRIGWDYQAPITAEIIDYGIDAKNINAIVINHKLTIYYSGLKNFKGDLLLNERVICLQDGRNLYLRNLNQIYIKYDSDKMSICEDYNPYGMSVTTLNAMGGEPMTYFLVVANGKILQKPKDPEKDGFIFGGWFKDETCETKWNFETDTVKENITLFAKWEKI